MVRRPLNSFMASMTILILWSGVKWSHLLISNSLQISLAGLCLCIFYAVFLSILTPSMCRVRKIPFPLFKAAIELLRHSISILLFQNPAGGSQSGILGGTSSEHRLGAYTTVLMYRVLGGLWSGHGSPSAPRQPRTAHVSRPKSPQQFVLLLNYLIRQL